MSRSPPAEKPRPAPVITAIEVSGSAATSRHTSVSSRCIRSLAALSRSGRFMVMSSTPGEGRSNSRCS